jgi:hypothetical protein
MINLKELEQCFIEGSLVRLVAVYHFIDKTYKTPGVIYWELRAYEKSGIHYHTANNFDGITKLYPTLETLLSDARKIGFSTLEVMPINL